MPMNQWMDKQNVVHPDSEILFSIKSNKLLINATWINLKNITLNEIRQVHKTTYYILQFILNSQKIKIKNKNRKRISDYLELGWGAGIDFKGA